jgi:4a-hydroxytetrahydrobiopterin dehydratase
MSRDIDALQFETGLVSQGLDDTQLTQLLTQLGGDWDIHQDDTPRLQASFTFDEYQSCLSFVQRVGELAEQNDHHPSITIDYGKVSVSWWTHTAGGIATNDILMAHRTSELYTHYQQQ